MVHRKELNPERSPRDRFGQVVRALRDERGWTQDELAERLGCSGSHVSAIETGRRATTPQFARKLDRVFGTGDRLERQSQSARQTALLEGFSAFLREEGQAAEVRLYEVGIIPGLLQTPEYAAALAESAVKRGEKNTDQAQERVALVATRQAALARTPAPLILAVLDEGCVRRPIGGPGVMDAQLERLLEFAEQPNTSLQIAPFSMGDLRPFNLPVTVLTLVNRSLMAYAESAHRGHLERESQFVVPILTSYHQLQVHALHQAATVAMIQQLRKGTP